MDKLMQTLFFYIEDDLLDKYCDREDQGKRHRAREEAEDRLRDAMTAGQLELLEAYLRASFDAETGGLPPAPPGQKLSCSIAPNPPGTLKPKC